MRKTIILFLSMVSLYCFADDAADTDRQFPDEVLVNAEAVFEKSPITIGEKVKYIITVEAPKDTKIDFPVIDNTLISCGFAVRDFGEEKPVKVTKNTMRWKYWYLLDTYTISSYTITPVTIPYTLLDGTKGNAQTKDAFLEVKSVIKEGEEAKDIKDIQGPVEIRVDYGMFIMLGSVVLLVILILGIGIPYYLRRRKIKAEEIKIIPPHIIALDGLEKIKGMQLDTEGKIKEYYISISAIIRHYIENRFNLHAPERTTEEFLYDISATNTLSHVYKPLLRDFLKHCDMVKFAKYGPTKTEIDSVYETAKRFVEETIPREIAETKKGDA